MELIDALNARTSVRSFSDECVTREELEELAEAVRIAPSACNKQPWRLVFVDEDPLRAEVARATKGPAGNLNTFAPGAKAFAVLVIERQDALTGIAARLQRREYPLIDIGIAAAQLCLRATDIRLGTCMIGWFDERAIKKLLGIPLARRIGLVIAIGRPKERTEPVEKRRKTLDEMRSYGSYGGRM